MRCQSWAASSGQRALIVPLLVSTWLGACVKEEYELVGEPGVVDARQEYGDATSSIVWSFYAVDQNAVGYELYGGPTGEVVCTTSDSSLGERLSCEEEGLVPNQRVTRRVRSVVTLETGAPSGTFVTSDPVDALTPIEPPPAIVANPGTGGVVRISNWCRPVDRQSPYVGGTRMEIQRRGPVPAGSAELPVDARVETVTTTAQGYPPGEDRCAIFIDDGVAPEDAFAYRYVYFDQDGREAPGPWSAPLTSCTGGEEVCDGLDNNCSGAIDDRDVACYTGATGTAGVGACRAGRERCSGGATTACIGQVLPRLEMCDGIDNDCDGSVDEDFALSSYFQDGDRDGYGWGSVGTACTSLNSSQLAVLGWARLGNDCDDSNPSRNPGRAEVCNGIDDDCDGPSDEGLPLTRYYRDNDRDGFGITSDARDACASPSAPFTATVGGDCVDTNAEINPGASEICDGIDNDCDARTDEGWPTIMQYADQDGDGFGGDPPFLRCVGTPGFVTRGGDCGPTNPARYPGAPEICEPSDDFNCDGFFNAAPVFTIEQVRQATAAATSLSGLQAECANTLPTTGCWKNTMVVDVRGRHTNTASINQIEVLGGTTSLGIVTLTPPIPGNNTFDTWRVCVPTATHATYPGVTARVVAPAGCTDARAEWTRSFRAFGSEERCDGHDSDCDDQRDDTDDHVMECATSPSGAPGYCDGNNCVFQTIPTLTQVCRGDSTGCTPIANTWVGRVMRVSGNGLSFPGQRTVVEVLDMGADPERTTGGTRIHELASIVVTSPTQLDNLVLPMLRSEYGHLGLRVSVGSLRSNVLPLLDIGPVEGAFQQVTAPARAWTGLSCDDGGDNAWTVDLLPGGSGRPAGALLASFVYDGSASGEAATTRPDSQDVYVQFSGFACNLGCSGSTNACGGGYRCFAGRCIADECTISDDCGDGRCILGTCQYVDPDQLVTCPGSSSGDITVGMGGVALSPNCQAAAVLSEDPVDDGFFNLQLVHLRRGGRYWPVLTRFSFVTFGPTGLLQYREDLHSVAFSPDDRFALVSYPYSTSGPALARLVLVSLSTGARTVVAERNCQTPGSCRIQNARFDSNGRLTAQFGSSSVARDASEVPYE